MLLFIFYESETLVELNSLNILLYSIIGGAMTLIFTSLFYIFFELPYKRLIHLICELRKNKNDATTNDNDEDLQSSNCFDENENEKENENDNDNEEKKEKVEKQKNE